MLDDEIKVEVKAILQRLNEQAGKEKPPVPGWVTFVNSPFVVTVAGGVFLSVISMMIQARSARAKEHNERLLLLQEKKHVMMVDFAHGMNQFLQCAPELRLRHFFLAKNKNEPDKSSLSFRDGRTWKETVEKYEAAALQLNKLKNPDSLCAQAAAVFEGSELTGRLRGYDELMDDYIETSSSEEFSSLSKKAASELQEVIAMMGAELKKIPSQ